MIKPPNILLNKDEIASTIHLFSRPLSFQYVSTVDHLWDAFRYNLQSLTGCQNPIASELLAKFEKNSLIKFAHLARSLKLEIGTRLRNTGNQLRMYCLRSRKHIL